MCAVDGLAVRGGGTLVQQPDLCKQLPSFFTSIWRTVCTVGVWGGNWSAKEHNEAPPPFYLHRAVFWLLQADIEYTITAVTIDLRGQRMRKGGGKEEREGRRGGMGEDSYIFIIKTREKNKLSPVHLLASLTHAPSCCM